MEKLKFVNGKISLAEGEGAGKHHMVIEKPEVEIFKKDKDVLLIRTGKYATEVIHPEHATIIIPKETEIEVFIQEEYDPETEYRKVRD